MPVATSYHTIHKLPNLLALTSEGEYNAVVHLHEKSRTPYHREYGVLTARRI